VEIFGTSEENATRVDLMLDPAPPRDLPNASQVIQTAKGEILGWVPTAIDGRTSVFITWLYEPTP
jgi:hypothetical protein